jgi:hypothetical protein
VISDIPAFVRVAALATIFVTACARPEIGADQARTYFTAHRTELERVIEQVELCQPDSGRLDPTNSFRCHSSQGGAQELRAAMVAADAKWIRALYNEHENEERSLYRVMIAMPSSYGLSYSGIIEAFVFEPTATEHAEYERNDDGIAITERLPVTDSPHHWYWWKIDR